MKIKETWKPIKGYEGLYEVSDLGNVRSLNYGQTGKVKELRPGISRGYFLVKLSKDGKTKNFLVHRLVYAAFRGDIPKGLTVDHVNGIKTDNRPENLQLLTNADNVRKANSRQLDLIEVEYPHRELTFKSSYIASEFFGYKAKGQIKALISYARKRGENFIKLRKTKYFFYQEA